MENIEELKRQIEVKTHNENYINIGSEVSIIGTNQIGKVIGQAKNVWIVEFSNGLADAYKSSDLKTI